MSSVEASDSSITEAVEAAASDAVSSPTSPVSHDTSGSLRRSTCSCPDFAVIALA